MATLHNPRRERFAQLVALGIEPSQAGREIGLSTGAPYRWMQFPSVIRRINEIKASTARKTHMDLAEMKQQLSDMSRTDIGQFIKRDADGNLSLSIDGQKTIGLAGIDILANGRIKLRLTDRTESMDLLAKLQKFYELPPSFEDKRQYNIAVFSDEAKEAVEQMFSGRPRLRESGNDNRDPTDET